MYNETEGSFMKYLLTLLLTASITLPYSATASDGYQITGKQGIIYFVAIDEVQKDNENVFRYAVGKACAGKSVCQVQYWIGNAPRKFPLTDNQVNAKLVQWQQNLNIGLRRWLVKCQETRLFTSERQCM